MTAAMTVAERLRGESLALVRAAQAVRGCVPLAPPGSWARKRLERVAGDLEFEAKAAEVELDEEARAAP
jgi:hypothetical protein